MTCQTCNDEGVVDNPDTQPVGLLRKPCPACSDNGHAIVPLETVENGSTEASSTEGGEG